MTAVLQQLLNTFDYLPEFEQIEIALEILKRVNYLEFPPLSDEDLVLNSEELFLQLDQEESA